MNQLSRLIIFIGLISLITGCFPVPIFIPNDDNIFLPIFIPIPLPSNQQGEGNGDGEIDTEQCQSLECQEN